MQALRFECYVPWQAELSPRHLLSYPGVRTTHVWAWAPQRRAGEVALIVRSPLTSYHPHIPKQSVTACWAPPASVSVSFGMGILQRSHQTSGTVSLPASPRLSVPQRGLSVQMSTKKMTRASIVLQTLICELCMEITCICTYTYLWQSFMTNLWWALSPLEKCRNEAKVTCNGH